MGSLRLADRPSCTNRRPLGDVRACMRFASFPLFGAKQDDQHSTENGRGQSSCHVSKRCGPMTVSIDGVPARRLEVIGIAAFHFGGPL